MRRQSGKQLRNIIGQRLPRFERAHATKEASRWRKWHAANETVRWQLTKAGEFSLKTGPLSGQQSFNFVYSNHQHGQLIGFVSMHTHVLVQNVQTRKGLAVTASFCLGRGLSRSCLQLRSLRHVSSIFSEVTHGNSGVA